jgi:ATP-binding cassette subfamily C protein LapB
VLPILQLIAALARRRQVQLAPNWQSAVDIDIAIDDDAALDRVCALLGWEAPGYVSRKPKGNAFPMLVFLPDSGWALAEQWLSKDVIRVASANGMVECQWTPELIMAEVHFPDVPQADGELSALGIFTRAILRRKRMIVDATLGTVVINVLALATSLYSMQVYDRVIPRSSFSTLYVLSAGMLAALIFDFLIRNVRANVVDNESAEIDAEVSEFFFARMQSVRLDARPPGIGTMAAQLRGLEQVRSIMASASFFLLADLPFTLIFIAVVWLIGGSVVIVPLITFSLALVLAFLFSQLIRQDTAKAQVSGNRKNGLLVEALGSAETIKANLGSWHTLAAWNALVEKVHHHDERVRRWSTTAGSTFNFLQQIAYMGIIIVGAFEVADHQLTMGGLIACTIIGGRINGPLIAALPNFIVQWGYAKSSLKALDALLKLPTDRRDDQTLLRLPEIRSGLKLEGVGFEYPGARAGLEIAGLFIARGEKVGIVGAVGSGKSTLIKLLAGLYAPQRGHVTVDGLEMAQVAENDLHQRIAYLPQDYHLLSGTLRDNLSIGIANPSDERLIEVIGQTGLEALVRQHPMGLDLPIAEGGIGLSGGQRALVGLTRTLLTDADVLLLDEATANLDQESEAAVLRQIFTNHAKSTIVMITHKPQLLQLVDRLIVVLGGRIVLDGKTEDVLSQLRPRQQRPSTSPIEKIEDKPSN